MGWEGRIFQYSPSWAGASCLRARETRVAGRRGTRRGRRKEVGELGGLHHTGSFKAFELDPKSNGGHRKVLSRTEIRSDLCFGKSTLAMVWGMGWRHDSEGGGLKENKDQEDGEKQADL